MTKKENGVQCFFRFPEEKLKDFDKCILRLGYKSRAQIFTAFVYALLEQESGKEHELIFAAAAAKTAAETAPLTSAPAPLTPEYLVRCITAVSPAPDEWFERAVWLSDTAAVLKKVLTEVEAEYRIAVEVILDDGLTSDTYEIVPLTKQERTIDETALRTQNPALYEQCAFVDADVMVRTLGKPVLRQMMIEKLGKDNVLPLESVTLGSVKEIVGDERIEEYVTRLTIPNGYLIREKEVN